MKRQGTVIQEIQTSNMGCVQCVKGGGWGRDLVCVMEVGVRVWGKCCCIYMKLVIGWYVVSLLTLILLMWRIG